jgi:hypothetical protein
MGNVISLLGPNDQSSIVHQLADRHSCTWFVTLGYQDCPTGEIGREHCLEISRVHCAISWGQQEDLFEGVTSLSEMKEKQLHQSRFGFGPENLLESINAQRPLIPEQRRGKTAMLKSNCVECLIKWQSASYRPREQRPG